MQFVLALLLFTDQHGEILDEKYELFAETVAECRQLLDEKLEEVSPPDGSTVHELCINMRPLRGDSRIRPRQPIKL